ncbi:hypothetical protein LguiB_020608 [Lonicera macranthoides]
MKTTILLFVLIALSTISLSAADASPNPVLDVTGKILRSGIDYHVLPVFKGKGGGLTLASTGKEPCPLDVVQEKYEFKDGLPLTFTPVNPKKDVIRVSTDLNIKFSAATKCPQSTTWKLDYDKLLEQYFITSGGVEGSPGPKTINNWFKIEKYENEYKFLFCPTVCSKCKVICRDVGIFTKNGMRRLALSDVPFKVMFKKA